MSSSQQKVSGRSLAVLPFGRSCKQEAVLKATAVQSPFASNVADSSLSSLSSTGGGAGGSEWGEGEGVEGGGDISSTLPYTALPHGVSP